MLLNFVKVNPSGNTTVYILDQLDRKLYPIISQELINKSNIGCEQVGFVEKSNTKNTYRLQMMGGEFCGNATRGLAAWISYRNYPYIQTNEEGKNIVSLEVSGSNDVLKAEVNDLDAINKKHAKVAMPLPVAINQYYIGGEIGSFQAVSFEGIVHAILLNQKPDIDKFLLVKKRLEEEIDGLDAIGVMFFDEEKKEMVPIVYVYGLDSPIWESSCGSGTVAVGCIMAYNNQSDINNLKLKQPGGDLTVDVFWKDKIENIYLSGDIIITAEGTVFVDIDS